ncbi:hypothetical protein SDC9_170700 [bioreactor metagenome]|uniref:Uncharacterized protein n=1 Tax=bioreactor metagenome TaxID=1076179 RepID=A0A645GBF0_9ZZZZ
MDVVFLHTAQTYPLCGDDTGAVKSGGTFQIFHHMRQISGSGHAAPVCHDNGGVPDIDNLVKRNQPSLPAQAFFLYQKGNGFFGHGINQQILHIAQRVSFVNGVYLHADELFGGNANFRALFFLVILVIHGIDTPLAFLKNLCLEVAIYAF